MGMEFAMNDSLKPSTPNSCRHVLLSDLTDSLNELFNVFHLEPKPSASLIFSFLREGLHFTSLTLTVLAFLILTAMTTLISLTRSCLSFWATEIRTWMKRSADS